MSASVLFVDDEPRVLDGVQRLFRKNRDRWHTTVANGGELALSLLEKERFDFVVSDMRMPMIDGARLLAHVRARSPGTVRLVLSGQTELDASLRAALLAHQFLAKPCTSVTLLDALERARSSLERLPVESCREQIVGLGSLPISRHVHSTLVELLSAADPSLDEVAAVIATDLGMRLKLMQVVASPFFGVGRAVQDVRELVDVLGPRLLKDLVNLMTESTVDPASLPRTTDEALTFQVGALALGAEAGDHGRALHVAGEVLLALWGLA